MSQQQIIWQHRTAETQGYLEELARQALAHGGRKALTKWSEANELKSRRFRGALAHVHGERHDLWWEFSLEASFRWQAHMHRLRPEVAQARLHRLTRALGLESMLAREVASLTHAGRALADLAVALLPQPALLLWEEPFYLLGEADAARAARLVRELHDEGMTLVAVASEPPGLDDLAVAERWQAKPLLHLAR